MGRVELEAEILGKEPLSELEAFLMFMVIAAFSSSSL